MRLSAKTQLQAQLAFKALVAISWLVFFPMPLLRFGTMNLSGLLTVVLAVLAVGLGYTSLLFNRARAHPNDRIGRRALRAADHALVGTILLLATAVLGISLGTVLLAYGFPMRPFPATTAQLASLDALPFVAAALIYGPAQFSAINFYYSLHVLIRRDFLWGPSAGWRMASRRVA